MPQRPSPDLLTEASLWITAQMAEEGTLVMEEFVDHVLALEWDALEAGADPRNRTALCEHVHRAMTDDGIQIIAALASAPVTADAIDPRPVPPELIDLVLGWEDEFLALAGITRTADHKGI